MSSGSTTTASCSNQYCHGTNLQGVADSGPSCISFHSLPYGPATVTCGACHRIPPAGNQAPNIAGSHTIHTAFTGTTQASCDACHSGASACVGDHSNGTVSVSVLATYNAKGATALYKAAGYTCSNISCHGGQTTPNWRTGSIDVNSQCLVPHLRHLVPKPAVQQLLFGRAQQACQWGTYCLNQIAMTPQNWQPCTSMISTQQP